jgi:hypothetical protein
MALFMTPFVGTAAGMVLENIALPEGECVVMYLESGRRSFGGRSVAISACERFSDSVSIQHTLLGGKSVQA